MTILGIAGGVALVGVVFWIVRSALKRSGDQAHKKEREADLREANARLRDRARALDPRRIVSKLRNALKRGV